VTSGFRHVVAESCALLGYYAASCGNFLPTSHYSLRKNPEERILSSGLTQFYGPKHWGHVWQDKWKKQITAARKMGVL
jgi:hypothetical protein